MAGIKIDRYLKHLFVFGKRPASFSSEKHKEWVRNRMCPIFGGQKKEPHHLQLKAQGLNDYTCVSLTTKQHKFWHDFGNEDFEKEYGVVMRDVLIATLIERIIELEEGTKG